MGSGRRTTPPRRGLLVCASVVVLVAVARDAAFRRNLARFGPADRRRVRGS